MSARDWVRNTRGEWYVLGQAALTLLVAVAPRLDGTTPSLQAGVPIAGAVLCLTGFVLAVLGSWGLGRGLSPFPRPKDQSRLVENGAFAFVRHPIYTGMSLLALGWSALWMSVAALVASVALFIFLDAKSRREERWLEERFADYRRYRARVRKLIPYIY